ncbi:MAG: hypothetical protein APR62_09210 [Smithella sp. SDB]|nr:MAG: hypothetical protein APR62_09210 [Smithella sp. SDB]
MKKIATLITTHPCLILMVAVILAILAALGAYLVPVNYDVLSYLPQHVESIQGQNIMAREFKAADTAYVLIKTKQTSQVLKIKNDLAAIQGVDKVTWLSDLVDPSVPDTFIPPEVKGLYKKGDYALLHLSFVNPAKSMATQNTVEMIEAYLKGVKNEHCFTGFPVFVYEDKILVNEQMPRCMAIATVLTLLVVWISTGSFVVAILFLTSMGFGILYNQGTNYLLGTVSVFTHSFTPVVQLGVTIDFSIFLMHRFREECRHMDRSAAMTMAIEKTAMAIVPCALVTMAGFLALTFMQIRIGMDMGVVIAKGVFFGLMATIIILPALTLTFERYIKVRDVQITKERFAPVVKRLLSRPALLLVCFIIVFIPAGYAKNHIQLSYDLQDITPQNLESMRAVPKISKAMGFTEMADILLPRETPRWIQKQVIDEVNKLPGVIQTIALGSFVDPSIPESFIPQQVRERFMHGRYNRCIVKTSVRSGAKDGNALIQSIRDIIKQHNITGAYVSGILSTSKDMADISTSDLLRVDLMGLIMVCLIIAIMLTSVSIPIILVASIQLAIFLNLTITYVNGNVLPFITLVSLSSIQLGSCVNYAIFLIARYREERHTSLPNTAMQRSLLGTAPAIFTSGLCLFCSMIGMVFISDISMFKSLALLIGRGALISVAVVLILLPGIIIVCDKLIRSTSLGWRKVIKE